MPETVQYGRNGAPEPYDPHKHGEQFARMSGPPGWGAIKSVTTRLIPRSQC